MAIPITREMGIRQGDRTPLAFRRYAFHHDSISDGSAGAGPVKKKLKIAVVDDEQIVTWTARIALNRMADFDVVVTEFTDPSDALAAIRTGDFDLLITDSSMPGMEGPALARLAKISKPTLKVIAMSGGTHTSQDYEKGTIDAFIQKPFDVGSLLTTARSVVGSL